MIISSMALVLVGFYVGLVWFEAARNMGLLVMSTQVGGMFIFLWYHEPIM